MTSDEHFHWGAITDVGRVREINQDNVLARDGLFVVADGMGGHKGGEVASEVAIESMRALGDSPTIEGLLDQVRAANAAILATAAGDDDLAGMGTTLCAIAMLDPARRSRSDDDPDETGDPDGTDADTDGSSDSVEPTGGVGGLGIVNVGDSRIYLFADGVLHQVSEDHSLVSALVREGRLTEAEAERHPQRNVVTRALGISSDVLVDYWEVPAREGDRYVLCSDGLFGEIADNQIASVLRRLAAPEEAAAELVRLANEHGARDNVTVIVVDVAVATPTDDDEPVDHLSFLTAPTVAGPPDTAEPAPGPAAFVDDPPAPVAPTDRSTSPDLDDAAQSSVPGPSISRWRTVVMVLGVLAILAVAFGLIARYARDNYFVTFDTEQTSDPDDQQVVIYQGRPDGVLWFDPTVEERTAVLGFVLNDALILELEDAPEFDSLSDAQRYVEGLVERAELAESAVDG